MNNEKIARLVANDPILAAELLRISNSSFYGFVSKVRSVSHAINLLGLRALRNLALCLAVRGALKNDAIPGFDITGYWEEALRHAICARLIGAYTDIDADECFTAGLLQEFGLLVLFYLHPDKANRLPLLLEQDPEGRRDMEKKCFGASSARVTLMLAQHWSLPEDLILALDKESGQSSGLQRILNSADWMAAVFSAKDKPTVLSRSRALLSEHFSIDDKEIDDLLKAVPEQVEEAAQALGLHINQQVEFAQVLSKANVQIIESNLTFQELNWQLAKALEERDQLAAELDRELKLAREMQRTLLPPFKGDEFPISGTNVSARYLSGDFYDYFTLDDGRIYFNLGDVSGKGTNAALMMAKTSSLFHCIGKQIHDPGLLLAAINKEICETASRGMFITMIAGLYDPATDRVQLVNAGHPPALVYRQESLIDKIPAQAPPLGVDPGITFPGLELKLADTSLYIYSDGVTEGHIAQNKELGIDGLMQMIAELAGQPPADRLTAIINRFKNSSIPLRDDVTLLLVENRQVDYVQLARIRFPSEPDRLQQVRSTIRRVLAKKGMPAAFIEDLVLAMTEACANIMQHASHGTYAGDIILEIHLGSKDVKILLIDFADPIDISVCKSRELDDIRPGGLGLHFMNELLDEIRFLENKTKVGNTLQMKKKLQPMQQGK
jgi:sigma-B regulation protein RsbU (phosphoserine phosphatase)